MYRSMSPKIIYCSRNGSCDFKCGRFHKPISAEISRPDPSKATSRKIIQSLDIPTTSNENSPTRLSVSNSYEPVSPFSCASTVTLDDIIASARRKTSADFQPILLPSPIFLEEDPIVENPQNFPSKRRRRSSGNSSADIDDEFIKHLVDSDSEDDYWFSGDPPSLIIDEDLADFDELMKVTGPPKDHFSNPIERGADPLNKKRNKLIVDDVDDTSSIDLSVADVGPGDFKQLLPSIGIPANGRIEYEGNL
ncbi:hypothetical protein FO519_004759 [Halicephalobus sp. NKZ332]|nr:hypothetical protein FO519_004759 [Halicephalobus sp. NKZ332]